MISWALVALLCGIGLLLAVIVGGVAAALPDPAAPHWSDRCRRGAKAFAATLTLLIALAGVIILLVKAVQGLS
ncbi:MULTISPECIES: hypothetical protein [Streptomyces]|uniref:Uncharacterized protein n=1 Tax=Streptomyces glycanivorans TaxID=3033808 RepID=A0ABY9JN96_9ACTN|nr:MULTISPECIES: hypothetical protein [unclassified Streptomyces]WLQ69210.1 hypothetical protein P8A20_37360 [Streptomyces sp. Alt3]WSR53514.1 hypothetical protein OG279_38795 [Streptomyces sp. NBC_01201]